MINLVETNIKNILSYELSKSKRDDFNKKSLYINIGLLLLFLFLFFFTLWISYKGKKNIEEMKKKKKKEETYLLGKINFYNKMSQSIGTYNEDKILSYI